MIKHVSHCWHAQRVFVSLNGIPNRYCGLLGQWKGLVPMRSGSITESIGVGARWDANIVGLRKQRTEQSHSGSALSILRILVSSILPSEKVSSVRLCIYLLAWLALLGRHYYHHHRQQEQQQHHGVSRNWLAPRSHGKQHHWCVDSAWYTIAALCTPPSSLPPPPSHPTILVNYNHHQRHHTCSAYLAACNLLAQKIFAKFFHWQ